MKLVLIYCSTDGYTYSCDDVRPLEYESAEQAIVDFEKAARESQEAKGVSFQFGGYVFDVSDFFYHKNQISLPKILTIDQWFNSHGAGAHG